MSAEAQNVLLKGHDGSPVRGRTAGAFELRRPAARSAVDWQRAYASRLAITDITLIVIVVFGTQALWIGADTPLSGHYTTMARISYWAVSAVIALLWMGAISLADSRAARIVGSGFDEYSRLIRASIELFGLVAIVAYLSGAEIARGYLLIALPVGTVALVLGRWVWRRWLFLRRQEGAFKSRVLLVGAESFSVGAAAELASAPREGFFVVGACTPQGRAGETLGSTQVPVFGDFDDIARAIDRAGADTVLISGGLPPDRVKRISWDLEAGGQHLVLAPNILDIAGPRLHARPVAGLPLIHVETPTLSRSQLLVKRWFDILVSAVLIIGLSPVLITLAAIVKLTSPGPVLYRQERIGQNGEGFAMLKFRSMRVGADRELAGLLEKQGRADAPLFKIDDDPRITSVGRVLRKYSLDELPQLFNVFLGSMSLVGPRPQVAAEVALYTDAASRRLLAKPGITGPWQVSGRSTLPWEVAVRLDLSYVENWSVLGDVMLLLRTVKVVLRPGNTAS